MYTALGRYGQFFKEPVEEIKYTQGIIEKQIDIENDSGGKGVFMADQPALNNNVLEALTNKGIPMDILGKLSDIAAEYQGRPLCILFQFHFLLQLIKALFQLHCINYFQ